MTDPQLRSAFLYSYPLFAFAETRFRGTQGGSSGRLHHNRDLSDHRSHWITSPNNDTLYSNAWLGLSDGPIRIQVGPMPEGRYWSLAFMDAYTNHFAVVGQRLEGVGPVDLELVGPGHEPTAGAHRVIRSPGNDVWMFCRCLVDGPDDLPNAHAMQDRITALARPKGDPPSWTKPERPVSPKNFLDVVNELLARNPVPADEARLRADWRQFGFRPGGPGAWNEISDAGRQSWLESFDQLYAELSLAGKEGRRDFEGWIAAASDIGNFGTNYPLRASVALGGIGALEPVEAMYFVKYQDEARETLTGSRRYLLTVPASGIPTSSFWSFTMYFYTPEGKRALTENPIARYSIGNRTPGLVYEPDGSLVIALQCEQPEDETLQANWLPTPPGEFHISLRAYLPHTELHEGTVPLPTVQPANG
ncbi:MAG: DUF1254 domain-containing protein [Sulfitobacter sp.]|nr:DUF1254 domain-containing protein [Sulfitobacter sp.]